MDLVARAKAIMLTPKTEWPAIESEPVEANDLFKNYVAYLAAIPAICGFIGLHRVGFLAGLGVAIVQYVLAFVSVYVMSLIIDALAPSFSSQKNPSNALKLAVYSMTPAWLAGIFLLLPGLHVLRILGLYSLFLLWLGLPALMKAPEDKATLYTVAVIVCGIVLSMIAALVVAAFMGM
jgi:hypothetical protein